MTEYPIEELNKKYEALPGAIKDVLNSVDVSASIMDIGNKNGLHIDQIGELANVASLALLGAVDSADLVSQVGKKLSIDDDAAKRIVADINNKIFKNIKNILIYRHKEGEGAESRIQDENSYSNDYRETIRDEDIILGASASFGVPDDARAARRMEAIDGNKNAEAAQEIRGVSASDDAARSHSLIRNLINKQDSSDEDIIKNKMKNLIKAGKEEVELTNGGANEDTLPKTHNDPYREPLG